MIGNTKTILGFIQSIEYFLGFQIKKAESLLGVVFVIGGAASAFRKEVFTRLGGYDTGTLTEDLDLSLRIQEAGMRIVYVPEAIVHTEGPTTLAGLRKQRLRWKRGRLEAFRMHRSSFFRRKGTNKLFLWLPFAKVFGPTYNDILKITARPMIISETGTVERGGNKAAWISDAYSTELPDKFPGIKGIVWFNQATQADWSIESSQSARLAYAQAIKAQYYASNTFKDYMGG